MFNFYKKSGENEFDLTDENYAQLPNKARIQEYFSNHSQNIHSLLLFLKAREQIKTLTPGMMEGNLLREEACC